MNLLIHLRVILKTSKVERVVFCLRSGLPSIFSAGKGSLETGGGGGLKGIRCGSIQVIFNGRILDGGIQEKKMRGKKAERDRGEKNIDVKC